MPFWVPGEDEGDFTGLIKLMLRHIPTLLFLNPKEHGVTLFLANISWPTTARDCSFKGWIVNGTNLIETLPNRKQTMEAIQALDLLVTIDTMPMEITGWADVVLPECTYLERYDSIRTTPHRKSQIALRMPAVEPLYDSKPGW